MTKSQFHKTDRPFIIDNEYDETKRGSCEYAKKCSDGFFRNYRFGKLIHHTELGLNKMSAVRVTTLFK